MCGTYTIITVFTMNIHIQNRTLVKQSVVFVFAEAHPKVF